MLKTQQLELHIQTHILICEPEASDTLDLAQRTVEMDFNGHIQSNVGKGVNM